MEYWNIGKMGKKQRLKPNIPLFQHSNLLFLRNLRNLRINNEGF
jgi:hypothetical protein